MGSHLIPAIHHWVTGVLGEQTSWYVQFALASLVLFGPGLRFFAKGVPALLRGAPDMHTLVALGAGAAMAASLTGLFYSDYVVVSGVHAGHGAPRWFESAAVVVAFVLLGRVLELRARGRTANALRGRKSRKPEYDFEVALKKAGIA